MNPNFNPLTFSPATGLLKRIYTRAGVSHPYNPRKGPPNAIQQAIEWGVALWDTGATGSIITEDIAAKLGLVPTGGGDVHTGMGPGFWQTYFVNIHLPNGVMLYEIVLLASPDPDADFDLVIGMDLITQGDFAITNVGGDTVMSYRMPSMETIDYEKQLADLQGPATKSKKPDRNDLCDCGSGRKYKHCHGR